MPKSHKIIFALYIAVWVIMAINPKYPDDWLLENLLIFIFAPLVVWMDQKYRFTLLTMIFLLIFASLHSLGSHYTYARMEHFDLITELFGFQRNHYDRVVHFLFGVLLFRLFFEIVIPMVRSSGAALGFAFTIIVAISGFYEVIEWGAAAILHPELGHAFLGSQGDIWDAQKDMTVATVGALLNMLFYTHYKMLFALRS